jgi:hypothetical protein
MSLASRASTMGISGASMTLVTIFHHLEASVAVMILVVIPPHLDGPSLDQSQLGARALSRSQPLM